MSTYIPTAIDEKAFEQAQRDALAAFAPPGAALSSGFLAGLIATWLPGIVAIPLLYLYNLAFGAGAWMSGAEKQVIAAERFASNIHSYSSVAIWVGLVLGLYGVLQAWLRQKSCLTNSFTIFELSKRGGGEVRLGLDAKITIIGFPLVAIAALWLTNQLSVLIIALVFIVCSGLFYNILWQRLDNRLLRLFFRPSFEQLTSYTLRLMVPRHVGWKKVKINTVEVDKSTKSLRVEGYFETDIDEKEARNIISHFMRGYHPIYLVNTRKSAS